ncbi:MAG: hypothetical protein DI556_13180 [Rhodovulum sulfidophilum]|uniref:Uncharacterized protein n=1 Tax=Rhodovulum sulfidophilum TaxID=35806 RepID=A0A2W5NDF6_RHOSU|nr:MAG: hypothetical protein DI556_13180 [Rhodovulum sulfidophilum]
MAKTYTLHIGAYSPETIPMARLAEYMRQLAAMLGHEAAVHFDGIRDGSTQLVSRVDHEQVPKVGAVLDALMRGEGAPEAVKAQGEIDRLLADDNATGYLFEDNDPGAEIIAFPGVTRPRPVSYGPIRQEGTLDGILVSVGGADKTIHIRLQHGDMKYSNIDTDRETARRLGKHLFEPIRVFGVGSWFREEDGTWALRRFKVDSFEALKIDDLRDVIQELRQVEGSEWRAQKNALARLRDLRDESGGPH